jgi:outer membrane receptor for ferrienterochelin and colicins
VVFRQSAMLIGFIASSLVLAENAEASKDVNIYSLSLYDLINLKIDAASGFTESLTQTPVPVTIITQAMIENSAALSLRDLLTQYVPGFTQVQDQNEYNVAFRGIYTSSQQKILILLNGKRINSRAYSSADPAHAISLDKLSQIEVIRGPGSSVYGNVALTAVINLKLKKAAPKSHFTTQLKVGNNGLRSVYSEWSNTVNEVEYFSWASHFETKGEKYRVTPENDFSPTPSDVPVSIRLDAFTNRPSTDVGFAINTNTWSSLLSYRQSHYVEPFSGGALTGEAYDYREFPEDDGNTPGVESTWLHFDLDKEVTLRDNHKLDLNFYYAKNKVAGSFVLSPDLKSYGRVEWKEQTFGSDIKWMNQWGANHLLFGIQYELNDVIDSDFKLGSNNTFTGSPFSDQNPVLLLGKEAVLSVYSEYKYQLEGGWLLNIGARFDNKDRLLGKDVNETSPRLAFIYEQSDFNLKLAYSRSFVDPPYWNRYSALASFRGSRDLKPEILQSYQVSPEFLLLDKSLSIKLNAFYNFHSDFVFRNNDAGIDEAVFANSGKMETFGLEHEWLYRFGDNSLRLVATHQMVAEAEFYEADDDEIFNIPKTQISLNWDRHISRSLISQLSALYLSDRKSPIRIAADNIIVDDPFPAQGVEFDVAENRLPSVLLINAKIRWLLQSMPLEVSLSVQNLFDKQWQQGGSTIHPYPQTGRWGQLAFSYGW